MGSLSNWGFEKGMTVGGPARRVKLAWVVWHYWGSTEGGLALGGVGGD